MSTLHGSSCIQEYAQYIPKRHLFKRDLGQSPPQRSSARTLDCEQGDVVVGGASQPVADGLAQPPYDLARGLACRGGQQRMQALVTEEVGRVVPVACFGDSVRVQQANIAFFEPD